MSDKDKSGSWFGRHKILTVIGTLVLLAIIGSALGGGDKTNTATSNSSAKSSATPKPAATMAKVGQSANDGKFAFTVNSIKCDQASVGSEYSTKTAQGQYCLLNISANNIGNESQTLDSSNQFLYNSKGQKYSADSEASYDANTSGSTFLQQINPGNSVTGLVVFDLPKGVSPISAELHDSAFSSGVKVNLQ